MAGAETNSDQKMNLEDEVNALFKLPLSEFIGARNELATRLKKAGRADDANLVKTLAKASVSAWAVNQLYWMHREAFDRLLETGERFRHAQASGKIGDLRGLLDSRGEALSLLSDLASDVLRDGGHSPTPDTIHRITTTLEALSATPAAGSTPGRLTQDVDPPSFASLASLIPSGFTASRKEPAQQSASVQSKTGQKQPPPADVQKAQAEETRRARIAASKASLQEAKKLLTEARSNAQRLEAAQKKSQAEAKEADSEMRQAEKLLRQAEERFKKASAASQEAASRAEQSAAETREASRAVEESKQAIDKATKDLESLMKESSAR